MFIFGGDHFGSEEAPYNVYSGAFTGRARRITFRATSIHTFALKNEGGSASATTDLGRRQQFLAWGSVSMVDP